MAPITFYVVLLALVLAAPAATQNPMEKVDMGFKVGMGVSSVADYRGDSKSRTGYLAGVFMKYEENRLFALQMELIYISKGYKIRNAIVRDDTGAVLGPSNFEVIFGYIQMPVMAKITAPTAGSYRPYLLAGGFAAYSLDNKIRLSEGIPYDFDLRNANDVDFGTVFGAGLDMKSGRGSIIAELRYDMSFAKVIKNQNQKLRMITFHIGYAW